MTFPEFQLQVQTGANWGKEGKQGQGSSRKEVRVTPGVRALISPQGIYMTIPLNCSLDTETPSRWERLTVRCPLRYRSQIGWNRLVMLTPTWPHHQPSEVPKLTMPSSLNHYCETPHYPLHVGTHSFKGMSPLWAPLPGKAIKLSFYFTPNLSSRFNSVLEYRGQIQLHLRDIIVASAWFSKFGDISRKKMCLPGPIGYNRQ